MADGLAATADFVQSASAILAYVAGVDDEDFVEDSNLRDTVVRRIEIIGEATGATRRFDRLAVEND